MQWPSLNGPMDARAVVVLPPRLSATGGGLRSVPDEFSPYFMRSRFDVAVVGIENWFDVGREPQLRRQRF